MLLDNLCRNNTCHASWFYEHSYLTRVCLFYAAFYHTIFIVPAWDSRLSVLTIGFGSGQLKKGQTNCTGISSILNNSDELQTQILPNATDIFDPWVFRRAEKCAAPSLLHLRHGIHIACMWQWNRRVIGFTAVHMSCKASHEYPSSGSIWHETRCLQSEKKKHNIINGCFFQERSTNGTHLILKKLSRKWDSCILKVVHYTDNCRIYSWSFRVNLLYSPF